MEELGNNIKQHKVIMANRKNCSLTGVTDVIAFDDKEVILETQMGTLFIRGEDMHIKRLTLELGEVDVEGSIEAYMYSGKKTMEKNESLLSRLFR